MAIRIGETIKRLITCPYCHAKFWANLKPEIECEECHKIMQIDAVYVPKNRRDLEVMVVSEEQMIRSKEEKKKAVEYYRERVG